MAISRGVFALMSVIVLAVGFTIGIIVGYVGFGGKSSTQGLTRQADDSITQKLLDGIDAENIRENLRKLTARPHLAGTPADYEQAEELRKLWDGQGLNAWLTSYKVLLSYPDENNPNRIELQDGSGNVIFTTQLYEKILSPDQNQSDVVPPYIAFSAPGTPKGPLIYVNYGRVEDFSWLAQTKNMDFNGKICIARYGKIFRGDKVKNAEKFGAIGLIIYSDAADYAAGSTNDVYPESWWLPETGVQRGSTFIEGDSLTPGYPSIESAHRLNENDTGLPKIPVHPISYGDAKHLLQYMTGEEVPTEWRGSLPVTYKTGPGFENSQWSVQMFISTKNKMATTYNAFAMIEGSVEPDRYVLLGNHRDAWVFGAVDPSSGTATMIEVARVMAKLVKEGWKPRRSILFCSWGAEEFGLIGSREWVEQYGSLLSDRAVAYLNVDVVIPGTFTPRINAQPIIKDALYEVAMKIPNPNTTEIKAGRKTLYDTWKLGYPEVDKDNQPTGKPKVSTLVSGSDFEPFITQVGVTCVDITYIYDKSLGLSTYPLYHSVYETFHLVNDIMDPTFVFHKAIAQYWAELGRKLADDLILPFDPRIYAETLANFKHSLDNQFEELFLANGLDKPLDFLTDAILTIENAAEEFMERLKSVDVESPIEVRMINDQLMALDRAFIDPNGLPGRPFKRNVVFAPSIHNFYAGSSFPGITDTLFEIEKLSGQEAVNRWEEVKKEVSIVTYYIQSAAALLQDWDNFQFS